jgi:pyruvate/2-oxoglutarate dehydrogenase complex dihydrolipoamide dehydrogenase (E3) component
MPIPLSSPNADWKKLLPAAPEFDVVVIGGGSAGFAAGRTAAALGARVAVIEGADVVGGLCILRGCMPSKALLESSSRWHVIETANEFGLEARAIKADMPRIQARKRRLIENFAGARREQLEKASFTFLRGCASFLDPHALLLEKEGGGWELLTSATFILSTGSLIQEVMVPGLKEAGFWTSDTALEATRIPQRLAVLGGGVVAVELGQFFSRVGAKTAMLQRSERLVRSYDPDVTGELERAFAAEKLEVITGVKLLEVSATPEGKKITYLCGDHKKELVVDEILFALGRVPRLKGLKLENAGVEVSGHCLKMEPTMATSVPHIFAAGDVVGRHEVVHIAIQQGEIAARNAVHRLRGGAGEPEKIDYRLKTLVTFTDPEIASVGLSEMEAREEGIDFVSAKYPFNDHGKSMIGGYEFGFVKLMAEKTRGEIIGAHIIGPHASDMIHEMVAVMYYHGTARDVAVMPHYHPTLAEIVTYPAEELVEKLGR